MLYTGYLDTPSTEEVQAAGIGGRVVIKPASRKELVDVIQDALHEWARSRGKTRDKRGIAGTVKNTSEG